MFLAAFRPLTWRLEPEPIRESDVLQNTVNRVVTTIVTTIHDKILIPRFTVDSLPPVCWSRERNETVFLNIIRPEAFYYSAQDSSSQEFDFAYRRISTVNNETGFCSSLALCTFSFPLFFSPPPQWLRPYWRGSNRQNYVVALVKRRLFVPCLRQSILVFYVKTEQFYSTSSGIR